MIVSMNVRAYVCREYVDMRNAIDGLAQLVKPLMDKEVLDGSVYVFLGKTRNKVKLLVWDRHGFWLLYKRLERGRFPRPDELAQRGLSWLELMSYLEGIDVTHANGFKEVAVACVA